MFAQLEAAQPPVIHQCCLSCRRNPATVITTINISATVPTAWQPRFLLYRNFYCHTAAVLTAIQPQFLLPYSRSSYCNTTVVLTATQSQFLRQRNRNSYCHTHWDTQFGRWPHGRILSVRKWSESICAQNECTTVTYEFIASAINSYVTVNQVLENEITISYLLIIHI